MTGPNMAAITASLERSLQSFSLNHHHNSNSNSSGSGSGSGGGEGNFSRSADIGCHLQSATSSDATLELNSNITLPYHWEQCLDLKTGEVYYINWRTGMKSKEDPRSAVDDGYFYSDEDDDDDDDEYESEEGSSVESSSRKEEEEEEEEEKQEEDEDGSSRIGGGGGGHVLVVAGCKGCFMYFMVPKQVEDCPKCCGQLLHFDRSDDNAA